MNPQRTRLPKKSKVYFTGRDNQGWALHHEMESTQRLLDFVKPAGLVNSAIIHTVYWPTLLTLPAIFLRGKRIISHLTHDPEVAFRQPGFNLAKKLVTLWIVRSEKARTRMAAWGLTTRVIPYILEEDIFHPLNQSDDRLRRLVERWSIPRERYLIGSFQRDTEGNDLRSPKLMKGPDIFAQIVEDLWRQGALIHVVLAGPRRFWLRRRLRASGVPFTFVGTEVDNDDLQLNTLSRSDINLLYNLIDVYLVSSRQEGGPQAVMEAAAAKSKVISTDVGHAREILTPDCIFVEPNEAVAKIQHDISQDFLRDSLDHNFQAIQRNLPAAVYPLWAAAYDWLQERPAIRKEQLQGIPGLYELCRNRLKGYIGKYRGHLT